MLGLRMPAEVTAALDAATAVDETKPSRSELIRRIVVEWLRVRGFVSEG